MPRLTRTRLGNKLRPKRRLAAVRRSRRAGAVARKRANLRVQTRTALSSLHERLGTTTIWHPVRLDGDMRRRLLEALGFDSYAHFTVASPQVSASELGRPRRRDARPGSPRSVSIAAER